MRYGINIPPFTDVEVVLELGRLAEDSGWDAVFLWDHVQWIPSFELPVHDPWALLSALAVQTRRVLLGTAVTPLARRRPQVVAKQVLTLDHLSGGRAILGVGLGEPPEADFEDFGDDGDSRIRAERLDESLAILDRLLRGEPVNHTGRHLRAKGHLYPGPVQRPRPTIFVAGVLPHRRPIARALHWDGFFPIGDADLPRAAELADFLAGTDRPDGWELLAANNGIDTPNDFAAAGATWLIDGTWPVDDWVDELRDRITAGPPA